MAYVQAAIAAVSVGKKITSGLKSLFGGDSGPSQGTQLRRQQLEAVLRGLANLPTAGTADGIGSLLSEISKWGSYGINVANVTGKLQDLQSGDGAQYANEAAPYWTSDADLSGMMSKLVSWAYLDQAGMTLDSVKQQVLAGRVTFPVSQQSTASKVLSSAKEVILQDAANAVADTVVSGSQTSFGQRVQSAVAKQSAAKFIEENKTSIITGLIVTIVSGLVITLIMKMFGRRRRA